MAKKAAQRLGRGDQYMLRLPDGMRAAIGKLAEANGRSINAEVIAAIGEHLTRPDRLAAVEQFVERHRKLIEGLGEYREWFAEGGIARGFEKLEGRVNEIDERTSGPRFDPGD